MNEKLLEKIGLTKGEITVYLALLKLGETTTGKIIKEAQISSGKIYEILDKLMQKGLAAYIVKEKTKYFSASSPQRILDYVEELEQKLNREKAELQKDLPSLVSLQKMIKSPQEIRVFRGFNGFRTVIYEALRELASRDEILGMGIITTKSKRYNILWQQWHQERIKKKIVCKMLFSDKKTDYYRHFVTMKYTHVKVLQGVTPAALDVMGSKAFIFTHGDDPSIIVVDNSDVAQSFRTFFESLWTIAKS